MKRRLFKTLTSVLLILVLLIGAMPVSAASVSTNYDTLVQYINQNGELDDDGCKSLGIYVTEGSNTVYFFLTNRSTGVEFKIILLGTASERMDMELSFILQKYNNVLSVKLYALYVFNNQYVDELDRTKSVNRAYHTAESEYTITGSTYIPAEAASELFNVGLQGVCMFWNTIFQEELGFGLKDLGFSSYCTHEYDHDCDTTCNLCGLFRNTSHRYSDERVDAGDYHTAECIVCGYIAKFSHNMRYNSEKSTSVSCLQDGEYWTMCSECGKENCHITPKGEDHHFFTNWKQIDEESHARTCLTCQKEEVGTHRINSSISIIPKPDRPGVLTHSCMDCDYQIREAIDYIPGDIDSSGEVNRDDVVALLLHVSMPDAFPLTIPADYNGDGLVTRDDVIQLLLHVSMPDAFPL